ncbi:hypothetical protein DCAR_0105001 [Daucus carota subsp. sativus]|uniref:Uncharacterized protein n=1 Tax=Daucus carota subsp. sativus TaxID=79200 RepID=A0A166JAA1_DAUCS|nr:hypothetical protein DCAR_0105001 [Daucus carota subsp. sativus]
MRGAATFSCVKNNFNPIRVKWGAKSISVPKKTLNNDSGEVMIVKEKVDPIVAFSKPPPLPPVIGPLVVLSLLDSYFSRDNDD